jgi:alkaline phosphatase D
VSIAVQPITRREFVALAASVGASLAWGGVPVRSATRWVERRDLFMEGVASGDPDSTSVLVWTRASFGRNEDAIELTVEVAEDPGFSRVIATAPAAALRAADYTCRTLVAGLRADRTYWYRFIDAGGRGSRIGRTRTAPAPDANRPVRFAFVSCQNICEGSQHAYRRMLYDDERAAPDEQLAFVLHLGDFIYEVVDYPEDRPGGRRYDRSLRDAIRFPDGERISKTSHVAASLADYRALYQAYLRDPDIQDARARWPFVAIWDNHEFSWMGWQAQRRFNRESQPAQTLKVAANQAWFEYQPARVRIGQEPMPQRFVDPVVHNAPVTTYDDHGLSTEPNTIAAIHSLTVHRSIRWGRHLDLLITDHYSYRSEEPTSGREAAAFSSPEYPQLFPQEVLEIVDAGRAFEGGHPPDEIRFGTSVVANYRKTAPPQTILGADQKAWFIDALRRSHATWKVWACSFGTLDWRADPQKVPSSLAPAWPGAGFAGFGGGDFSTAYLERGEIYDAVRDAGVTGFVTVSGDRHSFWAGYASKFLPPRPFDPVGVAFITGSVSAPGLVEALEHNLPKDLPLRSLYLVDRSDRRGSIPTINMLLRHGVRSCLEYARTHDVRAARRLSNRDLSPHLSFVDMGGHGYATVRLMADVMECEFVCIPRPIEPSERPDGAAVKYRLRHRCRLWRRGERPRLETRTLEGDPGLGL